jgi:hypothetical protein
MTATIRKTTTMLWPDGRLDVPEEIRRELKIEGGWSCSLEVIDGALIVRPRVAIPDEDLWAYEPDTYARLVEAGRQPIGSGVRASPQDLRDLMEGRIGLDELLARSEP